MNDKEYEKAVDDLTYQLFVILEGGDGNVVLNAVSNALGNCIFEVSKAIDGKIPKTIEESREGMIIVANKTVREVLESREKYERKGESANG